ncbi:MAG: family 16 glycosylhydrolase [Bacteroidales bacterium]|nr:family 16 glycosylhydrolase [Bacteroidales bacterium]
MKVLSIFTIVFFQLFLFSACTKDDETPELQTSVYVENTYYIEGNTGTKNISFSIKASRVVTSPVTVDYVTQDDHALAGEDYSGVSGTATIETGTRETSVLIEIIGDTDYEADEDFKFVISNATNAKISTSTAAVTIKNDDAFFAADDDGYTTPISYPGYTLVWSDEFNETSLNTGDWNYETGNHGWGNNELQNYVSGTKNAFISNGKLVIEARQESSGGSSYSSARLTTQGKQSFKYGRIDIRARLPKGQGIWPALWALGESISTVSWPACGEIDIMELIGNEPAKLYGTAHWDNNGHASYGGNTTLSSGVFADKSHVFSIVWNDQAITWYLDDVQYCVIDITPVTLSEFHDPYFFIFNIAVGGNWPGAPDATTVFPQRMVVDYIRVFQ